MKCIRELRESLQDILQRGELTQRDVQSVFLKVRQLFENDRRLQNQYPWVNLFCNWVVHVKLKDSVTVYRFLVGISKSISAAMMTDEEESREATRRFINCAENVIDVPRIRAEMRELFERCHIEHFLTDRKDWWDAFVLLLLREVTDKPLEFPEAVIEGRAKDNRASRFFDDLQTLPHSHDWGKIIRLVVFEDAGTFKLSLQAIDKRVRYVVELKGREGREAFSGR